ncbi:MAG: peptidoglycan DD-metalloendopeptidase family protein [Chthonomonadales bacterium]|nr:peptidoglycan DD-metalloendopeptidase family protein [Chthonomonadales bacterium]
MRSLLPEPASAPLSGAAAAWRLGALASLLAVAFCAVGQASPTSRTTAGRSTAGALHRKLGSVRTQIRSKRDRIRQTRRQERSITRQIESVEGRLLRTEGRLARSKARLKAISSERKAVARRIYLAEARLAGRRRILGSRLRAAYMRGRTSYVQVLLRSRSLHDYLSRSYYVERIVESDKQLMAGIESDRRQLAADRARLEAREREQAALRRELEEEHARYASDVDLKRDLLSDVRETREALEEALDQLEDSSREIEARIRAVQQTPRGRARLLRSWTGSFIRPASGPITSSFGMRYHPILHRSRMHTGVDIGAGYGSSIHAAAAGEVIMAGYMRGYGNTVIVDHGGGVTTLYGHCSALLVSEGNGVSQGQTIARVGSTGLATGPHLHFEVRHGGTPVNPL